MVGGGGGSGDGKKRVGGRLYCLGEGRILDLD